MPLQPTGRMPGTPNAIITSPMIVSAPHPPAASAVAAAAAGGNLQYPVAAPRSSRSAAAAAAAAAVAAGGGGVPRSKGPLGAAAAAGGFRHGSPGKLLHPMGQRMQFYPNLSGSETDVSTSTENLTQVSN